MLLRVTSLLLAIVTIGAADTLTLRSGQVVRGEYLGGDARHVKMAVGDRVENFLVDDVASLQFGGGGQAITSSNQGFAQQPPQQLAPPPTSGLQIAIGTPITVRLIDGVDSEQTRLGQTFRCSIDEPVMVDGQTIIPRGNDA